MERYSAGCTGKLQRSQPLRTFSSSRVPKYFLRVHLTVNGFDYKKHAKQVHVRPFVLLALLYFLTDRNHEVFRGKGPAEKLRGKMRQAVEAEYPDNEKHLPEEQRRGYIPESIVEALESFMSHDAEAPVPDRSHKRFRLMSDKNATPGDGARSLD